MSGSGTESHKAAGEARRDVHARIGQPSTGSRYDALLRYMRSLYVREPKSGRKPETSKAEESPKADPANK